MHNSIYYVSDGFINLYKEIKNKRFSVKCVRVPKEFVPEQDIPYVQGSEDREYPTVYSHLQTV
jgi:hypothetical protein